MQREWWGGAWPTPSLPVGGECEPSAASMEPWMGSVLSILAAQCSRGPHSRALASLPRMQSCSPKIPHLPQSRSSALAPELQPPLSLHRQLHHTVTHPAPDLLPGSEGAIWSRAPTPEPHSAMSFPSVALHTALLLRAPRGSRELFLLLLGWADDPFRC